MSEWRTNIAAAGGMAPSREAMEARRGFDPETVREVGRLVRRGEAAPDVPRARLAVALARNVQHQVRIGGGGLRVVLALVVVVWAVTFVGQAIGGDLDALGVAYGLLAVWGVWMLASLPRTAAAARRSEAANRRLLAEAGEPYEPQVDGVYEPRWSRLALAAVPLFVFYAASAGLLSALFDGDRPTVAGVLVPGLFFGAGMTAANLIWLRRRNRRAASG